MEGRRPRGERGDPAWKHQNKGCVRAGAVWKDGEELDHWRRGCGVLTLWVIKSGGGLSRAGRGETAQEGFPSTWGHISPEAHPHPTPLYPAGQGAHSWFIAGNLPGVSRAARAHFLPGGGGGRGGGGVAEGEPGCRLLAGSARPRSSAGCGLPRGACGWRRLYLCLISISLPSIPRLETAWDPPRPAGWRRQAWHCRCRSCVGAGVQGPGAGDRKRWVLGSSPAASGSILVALPAKLALPRRASPATPSSTNAAARLLSLGGEGALAGQEVCRIWRIHWWRANVCAVFTALTGDPSSRRPTLESILRSPLLRQVGPQTWTEDNGHGLSPWKSQSAASTAT